LVPLPEELLVDLLELVPELELLEEDEVPEDSTGSTSVGTVSPCAVRMANTWETVCWVL
jgi:hypothetical protein